jgi:hypothetical protein
MIYVHRNWSIVPAEILKELEEAATALEAITDKDLRKAFIKENSEKWSALRDFLLKMSHDKCWYSEAKDAVSRLHVDHFRPHGRAKQAERDYTEGYCWLAFDRDNFRLAGALCNTVNREHSLETVGKGDWFPLADPSKRANLTARSLAAETPTLLDPTDPEDARALIFNDDGRPSAASHYDDASKKRIDFAIKCLGLDQSLLNRLRHATWRDCSRKITKYSRIVKKPKGERSVEESETAKELAAELIAMSKAESTFSAVARSCLTANRLTDLIARNELQPLSADV